MHGYYRIGAAVPEMRVADVDYNTRQTLAMLKKADKAGLAMLVFPELGITGYTCADLFQQDRLLNAASEAVREIAATSANADGMVILVGAPLRHHGRLYNCAVLMQNGKIVGVVPKGFLPNYREFYEGRWFEHGIGISDNISIAGKHYPFGNRLVFAADEDFILGVEICEDLWNVIPPSSYHALAGATVLANLSASNELVAKADYRRSLVRSQSARCMAAYIYTSAGIHESSTDVVYGGHAMIAENGIILAENERFQRDGELLTADIDVQRLAAQRRNESSFSTNREDPAYRHVPIAIPPGIKKLKREISPHPFVPENPTKRDQRCREIFAIQASGLAKRLEHINAKSAVVGISGGLDSTLALLVTAEAMNLLKRPLQDIIAVTMPGFGTGNRTYRNAVALVKSLDTSFREIPIGKACLEHFKAIGHNPDTHDTTYENVQARERTQLLMDIANKTGGIVVGTGDLSEIALGWSTYNGDHMSMYAVNCGVPKSLVKHLIHWFAEQSNRKLKTILEDIIATPISPELLPGDESGSISQKTEDILGSYELHDFFLYHTVKYGAAPEKIAWLARHAFRKIVKAEEIDCTLRIFVQRFFAQQFKRSCIPDGPKVGTIALSPRGDWRMPSDAVAKLWLKKTEKHEL